MPQVTTSVDFRYDSLGRTLEESQVYAGGTARNVTNSKFGSYPATEFTFPNNRQTTNVYDTLYRRTLVEETSGGADIASWQFFGPNRVAEVVLGNGLIQTFMNNARTHSAVQSSVANPAWGNQSSDRLGYDGAGRPITKRYLNGGINGSTFAYNNTSAVVGFTTEYDQASNKLYERELHAENRSHLYEPYDANNSPTGGYDSLDRLRQYQRGTLSSTGGPGNDGGGSISSAITLPNTNESAQYDLDGLGNWRRFTTDPVGSAASTQVRQHNGLNEITRAGSTNFSYDGAVGASNGNLKDDGTLLYTWDALNRLMQVQRKSDNATIQDCVYDALNRRIRVVVSNGGLSGTIPNSTTDCLYQGWRCIEERNGPTSVTRQYVWGIYLDELIQQRQLAAINGFVANVDFYPLQDLLYRTMALWEAVGVVREAYDYDAYGNTIIFRTLSGGEPVPITWTNSDAQVAYPTCPFLFTGQRYDAETKNYYYKMRYYAPAWGRFLSRDRIRLNKKDANAYTIVRSRASICTDPLGLFDWSGVPFTPSWWEKQVVGHFTGVWLPPIDSSTYTGVEAYYYLVGGGVTKVACTDEHGCKHEMTFWKVCGGLALGGKIKLGSGAGVGTGLTNLSGETCHPSFYEAYFLELGVSLGPVAAGADIGLTGKYVPTGVSPVKEIGVGVGVGTSIKAVFCYYVLIVDCVNGVPNPAQQNVPHVPPPPAGWGTINTDEESQALMKAWEEAFGIPAFNF